MPRVTINETDNTVYGLSQAASDNIVFIPGNAITGPSDPTLVLSKNDFIKLYGDHAPSSNDTNLSTSWDYATSLLQLGMPVLYKRVIPTDSNGAELILKASANITTNDLTYNIINPIGLSVSANKETGESPSNYISVSFNAIVVPSTVSLKITPADSTTAITMTEVPGYSPSYQVGNNTISIKLSASAPAASEGYAYYTDVANLVDSTSYVLEVSASTEDSSQNQVLNASFLYNYAEETSSISNVQLQYTTKNPAIVTAKYAGTYGNTLGYKIIAGNNTMYMRIYSGNSLIESKRIMTYTSEEFNNKTDEYKERLRDAFDNVKFDNIVVTISAEDGEYLYNIADMTNLEIVRLSGGTDATDSQIRPLIASVFKTTGSAGTNYELGDKNLYDFKYIMSGGYTDLSSDNTEIASAMADLAEYRGDCIAVLDIPIGTGYDMVTSFFASINSSYAVAFAPWCYVRMMDKSTKWVVPSYVFLNALAKSVNSGNEDYMPPVGVRRGSLSNIISTEYPITTSIMDSWQETNPQSINPIMRLQNYGYVIYGQRTLYSVFADEISEARKSALQELFVRMVVNDIKKYIFSISTLLTFELNYLHTWNEFSGRLGVILNEMKSNGGISDYEIIIDSTTQTDDMNTISGIVRISVMHMVENFYIDFELEESSVTFTGEYTDEENF